MNLSNVILGALLLLFGRKLFWLFVAVAGFLAGMEISRLLLAEHQQWLQLTVALGAGLLGALVAMLAQRLAFAFAGFLTGSYLALMLAHAFGMFAHSLIFVLAGGLFVAIIAALVMDQAIILLSSLVGAGAVASGLDTGLMLRLIIFVSLALFGTLVQSRLNAPKAEER